MRLDALVVQERALVALLGPTILAEVEKLVEEQHAALPALPSGERRRFDKQVTGILNAQVPCQLEGSLS